jgi:predicted flavoprotein YhiN
MYDEGFEISIDLKPKVKFQELDSRVNILLRENGTTSLKNILKELLPSSLIDTFIKITNLDPYITGAQINKDQRVVLVSTLKDIRLNITGRELLLTQEELILKKLIL